MSLDAISGLIYFQNYSFLSAVDQTVLLMKNPFSFLSSNNSILQKLFTFLAISKEFCVLVLWKNLSLEIRWRKMNFTCQWICEAISRLCVTRFEIMRNSIEFRSSSSSSSFVASGDSKPFKCIRCLRAIKIENEIRNGFYVNLWMRAILFSRCSTMSRTAVRRCRCAMNRTESQHTRKSLFVLRNVNQMRSFLCAALANYKSSEIIEFVSDNFQSNCSSIGNAIFFVSMKFI